MGRPLVSILIPARDAAPWLAATLESALAQTWPHREIIVVENGSRDDTLKLAQGYVPRGVRVIAGNASTAAAARNVALAASHGEFIQFLDADDLLSPDKIHRQVLALNPDEPVVSLSARAEFPDGTDPLAAPVQRGWPCSPSADPVGWLADLLGANAERRGGFVALHQWLVPRRLAALAGPWNEALSVNDDGEFFCRVLLQAREIRTAPEEVAYYRRHASGRNLSARHLREPQHHQSQLAAIDLIQAHLQPHLSRPGLPAALARHYYDCAVHAYPAAPSVSRAAEARARSLDPQSRAPAPPSLLGRLLRRGLPWRTERWLAAHGRRWLGRK